MSCSAIRTPRSARGLNYDTLQPLGYANVTQYPGGTDLGIARKAFGPLGSASVLVEVRGVGQKSSGKLIRTFYEAMWAVLEAAAAGSLEDIDPVPADDIPERGRSVRDPTE